MTNPWLSHEYEQIFQHIYRTHARVIIMCSATKQSGCSTIALWLAQRCANQQNTLLVELDLCGAGLGYSPVEWQLATEHHVLHSDNLFILPQPDSAQSILQLRQQDKLQQYLNLWQQYYEFIVIDLGAVNHKHWRQLSACNLSKISDIAILSVALGKTTQEELHEAIELLKKGQLPLAGCIANQFYNPSLQQQLLKSLQRYKKIIPTKLFLFLERKIKHNQFLQGTEL